MRGFLLLLLLLTSPAVFAQAKVGVMGSLLYNVPDLDDDQRGVDEEAEPGLGIGVRALVPLTTGLWFRTGAGFVQKNVSLELSALNRTGKAEYEFLYLNIPATFYIGGLNEKFGVFFGTALNAKFADDCDASGSLDACDAVDEKGLVFPLVLGLDVAFTDKISMELSYEHGITDTADDLRINSAVLSFIYNFQ